MSAERVDIAVIGAGAAGLMSTIWAGRTANGARIVALDGASKLGAKILVAGGGRCNVTHYQVSERDFCGSTSASIRNVLRAFGVERTIAFYAELGVELKREDTGKLFPTTDDAHTVLNALLTAARAAGAELRHPARVRSVAPADDGFTVAGDWGQLHAAHVILCAGGCALPKSGSDGAGFALAKSLGHTINQPVVPALVPLVLAERHWLTALQGVAAPAQLSVRTASGKALASAQGSVLCTHFGLSGPAVLDISRHWIVQHMADAAVTLTLNWLPHLTLDSFDAQLRDTKNRTVLSLLREHLPERLARALCTEAGVDAAATAQQLPKERRRAVSALTTACVLPVVRDRGFTFAEATAGGVPLSEVHLDSMASRVQPGVFLAGEVCDVDGRIGGFNFQWAWASGYLAGCAAARAT